jgi:hypothetical protein
VPVRMSRKALDWSRSLREMRCVFCSRKLDLFEARELIDKKTQKTYAYCCTPKCARDRPLIRKS